MAKKNNYADWSKENLIKEVELLKKQKTYGLVWEEDKTKEDFDYYINWEGNKTKEIFDEEDKFPVLKELKSKSIDNDDSKYNLMIEGDNYHALAVLNFTHKKAIDVIYIDPPYNTGNNDFIFNDDFVEKEDAFRHSKWLSFMSKRLALVKNLLSESGVIFISIDDNEYAQLKLLCDEIFGEKSFVSTIIWEKMYTTKNDSSMISGAHEYILVYAKRPEKKPIGLLPRSKEADSRYNNPDKDPRGDWKAIPLYAKEERKNGRYPIKSPSGKIFELPPNKHWLYREEDTQKLIKDNRIWFGKTGNSMPNVKRFLSEVQQGMKAKSLWKYNEVGSNDSAKKEIKAIFGSTPPFDFPKPVTLIKRILQLFKNKNLTFLDFFAGSGTSAQAVLSQNKDDGGNRKFILCTNNEDNNGNGKKIATDVCYPRINRVIKGWNGVNGLGGNLKYFKTAFVDSAPTDSNKKKIVEKSTEMLCIKENAFNQIVEQKGFKIFKNTNIHLGIIFDDEKIPEFVKVAKKIDGKFNIYIFSFDESVPEEEFAELKSRIKLCPIPEVILHVYRRIFKK